MNRKTGLLILAIAIGSVFLGAVKNSNATTYDQCYATYTTCYGSATDDAAVTVCENTLSSCKATSTDGANYTYGTLDGSCGKYNAGFCKQTNYGMWCPSGWSGWSSITSGGDVCSQGWCCIQDAASGGACGDGDTGWCVSGTGCASNGGAVSGGRNCPSGQYCCLNASTSGTGGTGTGGTGTSVTVSTASVSFTNPLKYTTVEDLLGSILSAVQKIIVTLALVFIVIGAVMIVTSAGSSGMVEQGKKAITMAMVGLAIGVAAPSILKELAGILGWTGTAPSGLTLTQIALNVLNFLLGITGVIALIMLIIGAIMYLTSAGDEDRIDSGKKIFKFSLIGLIIAMAAMVLVKQIAGFFV